MIEPLSGYLLIPIILPFLIFAKITGVFLMVTSILLSNVFIADLGYLFFIFSLDVTVYVKNVRAPLM